MVFYGCEQKFLHLENHWVFYFEKKPRPPTEASDEYAKVKLHPI